MADKHSPNVAKVAVASALTLGILFAVCWLGTHFDFPTSPTSHKFVGLFTNYPISSLAALAAGMAVALAGGAAAGALWAYLYKIIPVGKAS